MKNQYLTDLGDYGKYALLRFLASKGVKIGVNWYLTKDDGSTDGKFKEYLDIPRADWMVDDDLFEALKGIKRQSPQTVYLVKCANLISGAVYYEELLDYFSIPSKERANKRTIWYKGSLAALADAELIFADPDNGISYRTTPTRKNNEKFILPSEVEEYYKRGKDVAFYCHKGRRNDAAWLKVRTDLKDYLEDAQILTLTYHKGTQRSYVFALHPKSCRKYVEWVREFITSGWYPTFTNDGMVFSDVFSFQEIFVTRDEREQILYELSNDQIDLLISTCGTPQAKSYYASFKKHGK